MVIKPNMRDEQEQLLLAFTSIPFTSYTYVEAVMATIHTFSAEEFEERIRKGKAETGRRRSEARTRMIEEYKRALETLEPGAGGEVVLDEGEVKRVERLNLKEAAEELEKALKFYPVRDEKLLTFQVITPEERAAQPRRGGRPRRAEPVE